MLIFIDTNIFYDNWLLNNANFTNFFSFVESTNSKLLISELVCDEVDKKYYEELEELKKKLEISQTRLKRFTNSDLISDMKILDKPYSFKNVLNTKADKIEFVNYDKIPNNIVVDRAINKVRPFQNDDKGFRDTLIWLSLLEWIKKTGIKEEIAFVNNNSNDFFNRDKSNFHDDLLNDIKRYKLKSKFRIYKSIKEFNNKNIVVSNKPDIGKDVLEGIIYPNEQLIENELELHINSLDNKWFINELRRSIPEYKQFNFILNFYFKIYEGIEDPELINWSRINDSTIYAELSINLRFVSIQITIPRTYYNKRRAIIKGMFNDIKRHPDKVDINTIRKASVNISFNYNIENEVIDNMVINELMFT